MNHNCEENSPLGWTIHNYDENLSWWWTHFIDMYSMDENSSPIEIDNDENISIDHLLKIHHNAENLSQW